MLYYKNKKSNRSHYIRITILILLIALSFFNPSTNKFTSRVANVITAPFAELSSLISNSFVSIIDYSIGTKPNRDMVNKLTKENQDLIQKNNELQAIVNEQESLKAEYSFRNNIDGVEAQISMLNNDEYFKKFTINKGSVNGIKVGDIVINSYSNDAKNIKGALVGQVVEVNPTSATVSSIMDETYNLTFIHNPSLVTGIIDNRVDGQLNGYMLDKTDLKLGDPIYTSGTGGRYKRGIYIGTLNKQSISQDKLRQLVTIKSPVDFTKLYNVFVIKSEEVE